MLFLKIVLLVFATITALVLFTVGWIVTQTTGGMKLLNKSQESTGIGMYAISALTLHSPLYWLVAVAILAAAGWLCWRWVF